MCYNINIVGRGFCAGVTAQQNGELATLILTQNIMFDLFD